MALVGKRSRLKVAVQLNSPNIWKILIWIMQGSYESDSKEKGENI